MCGFVGIIGSNVTPISENILGIIEHRGPDDSTIISDNSYSFGFRRLAIYPKNVGEQPIISQDNQIIFVYNGEVYNADKLNSNIVTSDTEEVLEFVMRSEEELKKVDGMFALAIFNLKLGRLTLARDRNGIKPLYYWLSADKKKVIFGSEIKVILQFPEVKSSLNKHALTDYFLYQCVLEGNTLFSNIHQVKPNKRIQFDRDEKGQFSINEFSIHQEKKTTTLKSENQIITNLIELIEKSVSSQLKTTAGPASLFLSGGIDSSIIARLIEPSKRGNSYVLSDGFPSFDTHYSSIFARTLGFNHKKIDLSYREFYNSILSSVYHQERPILPTLSLILSKKITEKVALTGDGADEIFAGYELFNDCSNWLSSKKKEFDSLPKFNGESASIVFDSDEPQKTVFDFFKREILPNRHLSIWDRGSMASGVEVRLPFLSNDIVKYVDSLPESYTIDSDNRKFLMRKITEKLFSKQESNQLLNRKKSAAPSALHQHHGRFRREVSQHLNNGFLKKNPFEKFFPRPTDLFLFEMFFYQFIILKGKEKSSEDIFSLHKSKRPEIIDALSGILNNDFV